jgi:hypothetical protein
LYILIYKFKPIKGGTGSSSGTRDNASNSPNGAAAIHDGEKRRQETALDGAIVESIPAKTLSAEDSDPQVCECSDVYYPYKYMPNIMIPLHFSFCNQTFILSTDKVQEHLRRK